MDLLRHGAMKRLFAGVRAPSTLGTFLRTFTFGHVRQLDAVASRPLVDLAGRAPLLPGADVLAYLDVDDTLRQTYGYAKQGAARGYTGVKGLNALLAVVSTPGSGNSAVSPHKPHRIVSLLDLDRSWHSTLDRVSQHGRPAPGELEADMSEFKNLEPAPSVS